MKKEYVTEYCRWCEKRRKFELLYEAPHHGYVIKCTTCGHQFTQGAARTYERQAKEK